MKQHEINFLNRLNEPIRSNSSITVNVNSYFTNSQGSVIDKNLLSDALKSSIPFTIFHQFDKEGGFRITNSILSTPWQFLYSFEYGKGFDYFQFSGLNTVSDNFKFGDLVLVYADDKININYMSWIVITLPQTSYSSFLYENSKINEYGKIKIYEILYSTSNFNQYEETLTFIKSDRLGRFYTNQINPLSYKTPETILPDFIRIKTNFFITSNYGFVTLIRFATSSISFNLKIKL